MRFVGGAESMWQVVCSVFLTISSVVHCVPSVTCFLDDKQAARSIRFYQRQLAGLHTPSSAS